MLLRVLSSLSEKEIASPSNTWYKQLGSIYFRSTFTSATNLRMSNSKHFLYYIIISIFKIINSCLKNGHISIRKGNWGYDLWHKEGKNKWNLIFIWNNFKYTFSCLKYTFSFLEKQCFFNHKSYKGSLFETLNIVNQK